MNKYNRTLYLELENVIFFNSNQMVNISAYVCYSSEW